MSALLLALALLDADPGATQDDFDAVVCYYMLTYDIADVPTLFVELYGADGIGDPGKPLPVPINPPVARVQGWWEWLCNNWLPIWIGGG